MFSLGWPNADAVDHSKQLMRKATQPTPNRRPMYLVTPLQYQYLSCTNMRAMVMAICLENWLLK